MESVKVSPYRPTLTYRVLEFIFLLLTTIILGLTLLTGLLSNIEGAGFMNITGEVSDSYNTQIGPAAWTFAVWGVIYTAQVIWIVYGWSFVFRPATPRAISFVTYIFYGFANLCSIVWTYTWGNLYPQVAFAFIALCGISLYATVIAQAIHLYRETPALSSTKKFKIDLYLTRIIVLNSVAIYASWLTAATQLNFVIVLVNYGGVDPTTAGTVGLSILLVVIIIYFILENTILDRFARFVFVVYPLLIWAFTGIVSAHWGVEKDNQNPIFTLVLLVLCIVLFIVRIILWIVFAFVRPLVVPKPKIVV
ncbi:uncharacterized protein LOC135351642 [Halichondria panicea]|uniref:uncharacterized protein LOC135351642 n=1 Tax=Halichondria panicea TaxID=6063 RepID=UPI00312B50E4